MSTFTDLAGNLILTAAQIGVGVEGCSCGDLLLVGYGNLEVFPPAHLLWCILLGDFFLNNLHMANARLGKICD